jgi:hypothetical protein
MTAGTVGQRQLSSALIESSDPHQVVAAWPMTQLVQGASIDAVFLSPPSQKNADEEPQTKQEVSRKPDGGGGKEVKNFHAPVTACSGPNEPIHCYPVASNASFVHHHLPLAGQQSAG